MNFELEWDRQKADANRETHGIAFNEAITVFGDPLALIVDDPDHSADERREIIIGYSGKHRLLLIGSMTPSGPPCTRRWPSRRPTWWPTG